MDVFLRDFTEVVDVRCVGQHGFMASQNWRVQRMLAAVSVESVHIVVITRLNGQLRCSNAVA